MSIFNGRLLIRRFQSWLSHTTDYINLSLLIYDGNHSLPDRHLIVGPLKCEWPEMRPGGKSNKKRAQESRLLREEINDQTKSFITLTDNYEIDHCRVSWFPSFCRACTKGVKVCSNFRSRIIATLIGLSSSGFLCVRLWFLSLKKRVVHTEWKWKYLKCVQSHARWAQARLAITSENTFWSRLKWHSSLGDSSYNMAI